MVTRCLSNLRAFTHRYVSSYVLVENFVFRLFAKYKCISGRFKTEVTKQIYMKFRTGVIRRNLCCEINFNFYWHSVKSNLHDSEIDASMFLQTRLCEISWYTYKYLYILWRIDLLLGNDSVNTFPREPTRNNGASIFRQRISKHASLTIEAVFFACSMQSCYKNVFRSRQ
jgi:hypothetical protein